MTGIADAALPPAQAGPPAGTVTVRAGRPADLARVHEGLMEAILTSPYYGETFKAYEAARLTRNYLEDLLDQDPHHILVAATADGRIAGFMISGPDHGTLWLFWTFIFPEFRRSRAAVSLYRQFLSHWDHGRFHKVSTFTRPDNDAINTLIERFGFVRRGIFEKHIFGEDYCVYECPLTKTEPGYDAGLPGGWPRLLRRLVRPLKRLRF